MFWSEPSIEPATPTQLKGKYVLTLQKDDRLATVLTGCIHCDSGYLVYKDIL